MPVVWWELVLEPFIGMLTFFKFRVSACLVSMAVQFTTRFGSPEPRTRCFPRSAFEASQMAVNVTRRQTTRTAEWAVRERFRGASTSDVP